MSVQKFLKSEEVLELLNSLDSNESDIYIAVLPDISELTDEEGDDNEVNTTDVANEDDSLITADEIRVFIEILLLALYNSNTYERDLNQSDVETLELYPGEKCHGKKSLPKVEILFTLLRK
ncbi:hypothetical protein TNCV_2331 [Trichonephila clavipes]|nr:hypothetical protein TNCV_2331 [Trichonephila clavipes]